jgi:hypothetical protein
VRAIYSRNREATCRVLLGPASSNAALVASVRSLVAWLSLPPTAPLTIQYQAPNASSPVYLDVVGCAHSVPTDEASWLQLQLEPLEIVFICRPGLRGDRVTLQNLLCNPGYEQGSQGGVTVFSDSFANSNAYSVQVGSALSVGANVLTVPSGTRASFGSPAWGAVNKWQTRFQFATGLTATWYLHWTDANNTLACVVTGSSIALTHTVGGSAHSLASNTPTLTNGTWYWLVLTQFPGPGSSEALDVAATLYADSTGAIGSAVSSGGASGPTYDGVTAVAGQPQIAASGASLNLGGAYSNVHTVSLFGPGGWTFSGTSGTGPCSGSWEGDIVRGASGNQGNTYPSGPVTSYGAARVDLPSAGTVSAQWASWSGSGGAAGSTAIPVQASGQRIAGSAWAKSSGLGSGATLTLSLAEYDASSSLLRSTTLQQLTGNQASWVQLSGSVVTGVNTAYAQLTLTVADTNAGASANGTVWLDNAQAWNVTTTGIAAGSMPYCELRFTQAPAQLLLSGLLGDLPCPAMLELGTYISSLAAGGTLTYAVGRRGTTTAGAILTGPSHGFYPSDPNQATAVLDASGYNGYYVKSTVTNGGWNPRAFSPKVADAPGVYHVLTRYRTQDATPTGVQVRIRADEMLDPWYADIATFGQIGSYYGPYQNPLASASVWTLSDTGQVALPPFPKGAAFDPTQLYSVIATQWVGTTGGGAEGDASWQCLLPVDGSLVYGQIINPSNTAAGTLSSKYVWGYLDGLLVNRASVADGPAWGYSLEATAIPNPGHGGGGAGTQATGVMSINTSADPYLQLDPGLTLSGQSGGINQMVAVMTDDAGAVLPIYAEVTYSPLYLWPR